MAATWTQLFPPKPTFTDAHVTPQTGRIFIVTGGYSGIGYNVASILYRAGGKVYIAGRSQERALAAIDSIKESSVSQASSTELPVGELKFLSLNLEDLASIRFTAAAFQSQETKLDVLFNNAGVSLPPTGSRSSQGYELQMATNCLGPLLLTLLLLPQLKMAKPSRVIWTSSQVVELSAPKGGVDILDLSEIPTDQARNYTNTKTGNYFLASEFARTEGTMNGILSVTTNPGALKTELLRHKSALFRLLVSPLLYPAVNGAYTELFAGLSEELSLPTHAGAYVIPWGRVHPGMREDLLHALQDEESEGGTGQAKRFWEWCNEQIRNYL